MAVKRRIRFRVGCLGGIPLAASVVLVFLPSNINFNCAPLKSIKWANLKAILRNLFDGKQTSKYIFFFKRAPGFVQQHVNEWLTSFFINSLINCFIANSSINKFFIIKSLFIANLVIHFCFYLSFFFCRCIFLLIKIPLGKFMFSDISK